MSYQIPIPLGINITNGVPSEIYVGIGREHYEDQYEVAEAVARSFEKTVAELRADNERLQRELAELRDKNNLDRLEGA